MSKNSLCHLFHKTCPDRVGMGWWVRTPAGKEGAVAYVDPPNTVLYGDDKKQPREYEK